jgi:poly-gamma-glutamate biosynthesis protein PgsC/CapC
MQPEWTIGIAIGLSMLFTRRTGLSCGGVITPGLLAISLGDPLKVGLALGMGVVLSFVLEACVRVTGIYGRERLALSLLLALVARMLFQAFAPIPSLWLGWVVPGLVAADIQRQGIVGTLSGAVSVSVAAAFVSDLALRFFAGGFP